MGLGTWLGETWSSAKSWIHEKTKAETPAPAEQQSLIPTAPPTAPAPAAAQTEAGGTGQAAPAPATPATETPEQQAQRLANARTGYITILQEGMKKGVYKDAADLVGNLTGRRNTVEWEGVRDLVQYANKFKNGESVPGFLSPVKITKDLINKNLKETAEKSNKDHGSNEPPLQFDEETLRQIADVDKLPEAEFMALMEKLAAQNPNNDPKANIAAFDKVAGDIYNAQHPVGKPQPTNEQVVAAAAQETQKRAEEQKQQQVKEEKERKDREAAAEPKNLWDWMKMPNRYEYAAKKFTEINTVLQEFGLDLKSFIAPIMNFLGAIPGFGSKISGFLGKIMNPMGSAMADEAPATGTTNTATTNTPTGPQTATPTGTPVQTGRPVQTEANKPTIPDMNGHFKDAAPKPETPEKPASPHVEHFNGKAAGADTSKPADTQPAPTGEPKADTDFKLK